MKLRLILLGCWLGCFTIALTITTSADALAAGSYASQGRRINRSVAACEKLRLAVTDLSLQFGERYPDAESYLARLHSIEARLASEPRQAADELESLRREALMANPLLDCRVIVVKRRANHPIKGIAIPAPHETNSGLPREGYDNEVLVVDLKAPIENATRLLKPEDGGYVGELDLHFDADRILLTRSDRESWKLWEMDLDGSHLHQVSQTPPDVDCFDGCYVPDGGIVFASTASYQSVPCWHGKMPTGNLYRMNPDGTGMRQLCFDQDVDAHPVVLNDGQVMFSRWDYTGVNHIFQRELMVMNPDGTGQRAVYGSNSYFPNSLFFPRPLPGPANRLVSILSGYHGVPRMGWLVMLDPSRGWYGADGMVHRISGTGAAITPVVKDNAVDQDWPKFLHPYPLSDKYFLVSMLENAQSNWTVCVADVFDNVLPIFGQSGYAMLEPIPVVRQPTPPVIPDQTLASKENATVYLNDIYSGPGLKGVPRGTVKALRVLSYHFGYRELAGSDKIGYGGPWDGMQIEGTVPVEQDGSAVFEVPARTPLAIQPLDEEGKAVQLMRSWFTAMPGEVVSCVGCHETPTEVPRVELSLAAAKPPRAIDPWYGPPRGFDFAREVQPVLDHHCAACHDGSNAMPDLRAETEVAVRQSWPIGYAGRLDQQMMRDTGGRMTYTPAYDALIHYIRRVGVEDAVGMHRPGEYHADTSPLVQLLRKGHQGVELSAEDWDRIVTWIDLNGPCHGTWGDVYPIPNDGHQRRMTLRRMYGGALRDPEVIPAARVDRRAAARPNPPDPPPRVTLEDDTLHRNATRSTGALDPAIRNPATRTIDLGDGVTINLVQIPAGRFVMGSVEAEPDEWPPSVVEVTEPFWMATTEITNEQFARFDPGHDSGFYARRLPRPDCEGTPLSEPKQPVVRVSWEQANRFCEFLSKTTGQNFQLPTEQQWEYACRAGTETPLWFGDTESDFSLFENLADATFSRGVMQALKVHPDDVTQWSGGVPHLVLEGARLAEDRFNDGYSVTAPVDQFKPNPLGLADMHGNVAEWTQTQSPDSDRRVVRGGSFFDPPHQARSAVRRQYHPWQPLFNVGFRVVSAAEDGRRHSKKD
ncbi:SUMF1/EgtB/PvdO family nonheme iron enzyme [Novipirellula artificiosorum]|uniref:Formylglycine-generating sulfatase enzyme n=1 Tax=Novipirellula artificiosorum TaxID=2528016 RepID=A0A5C6E0U5_9BACT|nr:SUMF1/EgtB/PvdO family nonheme iron enzyme [Novipirellula artificiosorum]TWU42528.1 Formylglycine-generating sulfatase enzyme [Novipirellula artificiosorum]